MANTGISPRFRFVIPNTPMFNDAERGRVMDGVFRPIVTVNILKWSREAKILTPVDLGPSKASIFANVTGGLTGVGQGLRGVTGGTHAIIFLERGTKPHWPPIKALEGWAQRKLGDRRLAFVVARAISKRGTKAIRMFAKSLEKLRPEFISSFQAGVREMNRRLGGK